MIKINLSKPDELSGLRDHSEHFLFSTIRYFSL